MKLREILEQVLEEKRKCKKRKKVVETELENEFDGEELEEKRKCKKRKKVVEELNDDDIEEIMEEIDDIIDMIELFENDEIDEEEEQELVEAINCLDEEVLKMLEEAIDYDEDELEEALYLNKTPMSVRAKARKYARSSKGKLARKKYLKKLRRFKQKIKACKKRGLTFSLRQMKCVKPKKRKGS
jgi:hypothetical protein